MIRLKELPELATRLHLSMNLPANGILLLWGGGPLLLWWLVVYVSSE